MAKRQQFIRNNIPCGCFHIYLFLFPYLFIKKVLEDENENIVELWCPPEDDLGIRWAHLFDNVLGHSGFFIRRNCMDKEEWYRTPYAEEYDLAVRLSHRGKVANIPQFLTIYRDIVKDGITHTKWSQQKGFAEKISMDQLIELMGEKNITQEQRFAAWKLIHRPWQIKEPQTALAVETLKRIAKAFCRVYPYSETKRSVRNAFASYAKKLLLPVEGDRINQFQNLRAALKLHYRISDVKNVLAAVICSVIGPQNGRYLFGKYKEKIQTSCCSTKIESEK